MLADVLVGAGPDEIELQIRIAVISLARRREIPAVDVIGAQVCDARESCVEGSQGVKVSDKSGALDDQNGGE